MSGRVELDGWIPESGTLITGLGSLHRTDAIGAIFGNEGKLQTRLRNIDKLGGSALAPMFQRGGSPARVGLAATFIFDDNPVVHGVVKARGQNLDLALHLRYMVGTA